MIERLVLLRKISRVRRNLSKLKSRRKISLEAFLKDEDIQDIILRNLQVAIQACIDIGSHIISEEGWGIPGSLTEIFYILQDNRVIMPEITDNMVKAVGFRNIIVHNYEEVDLHIVYDVFCNRLEDIEDFLRAVVDYYQL